MSELLFGPEPEVPDGAPRTVRALFDQGVWWKSAAGWIRIADMTGAHRNNVMTALAHNASVYADRVSLSELSLMTNLNAPDEVVEEWIGDIERRDASPLTWLISTPLYLALMADAADETSKSLDDKIKALKLTQRMVKALARASLEGWTTVPGPTRAALMRRGLVRGDNSTPGFGYLTGAGRVLALKLRARS